MSTVSQQCEGEASTDPQQAAADCVEQTCSFINDTLLGKIRQLYDPDVCATESLSREEAALHGEVTLSACAVAPMAALEPNNPFRLKIAKIKKNAGL